MKIAAVVGEKNYPNRDALRKSLFTNQPCRGLQEKWQSGKENNKKESEPGSQVSDLMKGMKEIQVGDNTTDQKRERCKRDQKVQPVGVTNGSTTQNQSLKPTNILHPTTKTLTPTTTPIPAPSTKIPSEPPEYTSTSKETNVQSPKLTKPETSSARKIVAKPHSDAELPTLNQILKPLKPMSMPNLIPFDELAKMVKNICPAPITNQPTQNNQPDSSDVCPTSNNQNGQAPQKTKPEASAKPKTWNRIPLKTPKIEGDVVMMGKRNNKDECVIQDSMLLDKKCLKRGLDNTNITTAKADNQPRRSS